MGYVHLLLGQQKKQEVQQLQQTLVLHHAVYSNRSVLLNSTLVAHCFVLYCSVFMWVLGSGNNNTGINTVVLNGKTGKVAMVQTFNVLDGEVQPLIEFLQGLEKGNIVLMATFDDPATK
ncbi:unnamed protein product [Lota lota]